VSLPGLVPSDIAAALGVIADMTAVDGSATESRDAFGARAVHFVDPFGRASSYSVSSPSSSIDSSVVRFCSGGHRCSGTYTPRVTTRSIEPGDPSSETARQMSSGNDRGGT
jgi:hypothetical protein